MGYSIKEKLITKNPKTRPGTKISVKGVVIHWTANTGKGADSENHYTYFNRGLVYASAHYFVDKDQILRIIPENEMAYHVGATSYKTKKYGSYPNNAMIGVEMCVNSDGNFKETYKKAVWLVADILKRHKLGVDDLERHFDITGKDCPKMFVTDSTAKTYLNTTASKAWAQFQADVKEALTGKSTSTSASKDSTIVDSIIGKLLLPENKTKSNDVVTLQKGLIALGYKLPEYGADGYYGKVGEETEKTVRKFQKDNKLTVDGKAGPATIKKMQDLLRKKAEATTDAPKTVAKTGASHKVVKGDTLWGISQKYNVSVADIKKFNDLDGDTINPGDVLYLSSVYTVKKGDTLWSIATKNKTTVAAIKKANGLTSDAIDVGDKLTV